MLRQYSILYYKQITNHIVCIHTVIGNDLCTSALHNTVKYGNNVNFYIENLPVGYAFSVISITFQALLSRYNISKPTGYNKY